MERLSFGSVDQGLLRQPDRIGGLPRNDKMCGIAIPSVREKQSQVKITKQLNFMLVDQGLLRQPDRIGGLPRNDKITSLRAPDVCRGKAISG